MYCCCLVTKSCLILHDPMDWPGFPVLHHLPEHVHWISDTVQPSHPLLCSSFHLQSFPASGSSPVSQLFTSGGQSFGSSASASVLPLSIQSWFPLGLTGGLIFLLSKGLSRVFYRTTVQKQFFGVLPSLGSISHIHIWLLERLYPWLYWPLSTK